MLNCLKELNVALFTEWNEMLHLPVWMRRLVRLSLPD